MPGAELLGFTGKLPVDAHVDAQNIFGMYFLVRSDGRRLYTRPVENPWIMPKVVPNIPNESRCRRERVHIASFFLPACASPLHALRDAESSIVQEKRKRHQEASNNVADWKLETSRFR